MSTPPALYDQDFFLWTQAQAAALRNGNDPTQSVRRAVIAEFRGIDLGIEVRRQHPHPICHTLATVGRSAFATSCQRGEGTINSAGWQQRLTLQARST